MLILLYFLFLIINIFVLRWLVYLFDNIRTNKDLQKLFPLFALMILSFVGWSIMLYVSLTLLYMFNIELSVLTLKLAFIFATLLIVSISYFSIRVFLIMSASKENLFIRVFNTIVFLIFTTIMFWTVVNIDNVVINAIPASMQFVYGSMYSFWRNLFVSINIFTIIVGGISYIYNQFKQRYYYSAYRIIYTMLAYIVTILWGFFWNVVLPNTIHSSMFSVIGPLGSLWFFYFSVNIIGPGIPAIVEEFENLRRSSRFWFGVIFGFLIFMLILFIPSINVYLKLVTIFIFVILIGILFQLFSFQQKIIGYELNLFDLTVESMSSGLNLQIILAEWLKFVRRFFKDVGIVVIGIPSKNLLLVDKTDKAIVDKILKLQVDSNLGFGWIEYPEYLIIYDSIQLPKKIGLEQWGQGDVNIYDKLYVFYKLDKRYVSFYYFFKYTKLYLRLLVFFVYLVEKSQHFNDILEKRVQQRTAELVRANRRMVKAYNRLYAVFSALRTSDEAKTMFLSVVSHQLRTPLSVIRNYVDMLESQIYGELNPKQTDILQRIKDAAIRLKGLVIDVLQSSRLERGKFNIILSDVVLADVLTKVFEQYIDMAKRKNLMYQLHVDDSVKNLVVRCDKDKMFESFSNIIDNAIHYTPNGGRVDVYLYTSGKNKEWVIFAVKDTGIGIPKSEQHKLFGKFTRLDNAKKMRPDGTGIGLYLVKQIVESHNGRVWFESEVGKGTTFYIALSTDKDAVEKYVKEHSKDNKVIHAKEDGDSKSS